MIRSRTGGSDYKERNINRWSDDFYSLHRINNQPLKRHQDPKSLPAYSQVCVRLLAMLLRPKTSYSIPLPSKVAASVNRLRAALETKNKTEICGAVHDTLFRLWTRVWDKSAENSIGDPTVCLVALSMLKQDGSFLSPHATTPFIAKLEYCMRLVFLLAVDAKRKEAKISTTKACDMFARWFTEKEESTFNSLRSLQHRATALAKSEISMPRVVWTDRTSYRSMRYAGDRVQFDQFNTVFSAMERDAITIWEQDILLGLPLRVSYSEISDDIANNDVGYSFIFDRRNRQFRDRDMLIKAIAMDPVLSKRFLTGARDSEGVPIWNILALQKWLFDYGRFHGVQLASVEMKAGSPGRGTEITCLEYRNTRTRSTRGLLVVGDHLAVLCQYHKSASITGKDKVIPHSLDAVTADLVIQDLAIARPFAELAAYICYPKDKDIQGRYNSYLFINNRHLFTTAQLTNVIKLYTLPVFSFGMGVNDWRHISAAFRRKLCPGLESMLQEDENESVPALQSGHTRDTENRTYGISSEMLAGAAEDVLPLFLDASTDWQVANRIVPGGHLLPYREATADCFSQLAAAHAIKTHYSSPQGDIDRAVSRAMEKIDVKLDSQATHIVALLQPQLEKMMENILQCR